MHGIHGMTLQQVNKRTEAFVFNDLTEKIIGCSFAMMNVLGCGFLEKVYENALAVELRHAGLSVVQQKPITVKYRDVVVGEYVADLVVEDKVLVELKAA